MSLNVRDLLLLSCVPGVGAARLRALINHFQSPEAVARASARDLVAVEGIERKTALAITGFYRNANPASFNRFVDDQILRVKRVGGTIITYWDPGYPHPLKRIFDPPPLLFVRGEFSDQDNESIAIVGTRSPTPYGVRMAERIANELVRLGITIVSGLARGIDTVAHNTVITSRGRTIAVIGSGLDNLYPPENSALAEKISRNGVVASEFLMGTKPDAGNFPQRNRIISGLSLGTVIVETGTEGGAMITARTALDQNREVFAVPAAVDARQRSGCNLLIKEGRAALLETIDDIIVELGPRLHNVQKNHTSLSIRTPPPNLSLFEQSVFDILTEQPQHVDVVATRAGLPVSETLVHLLGLEFKGAARQIPGKMFVRSI